MVKGIITFLIFLFRRNLTRMSLFCWLTVFLVLPNLQPQGVAGLGQGVTSLVATGPPLNCGIFSTGKPVDLDPMSLLDQEKMLNRFIACIGANSFLDIDGLYFLYNGLYKWLDKSKFNGLMVATALGFNDLARTLIHYDANINVRNEYGQTSLHCAALAGNLNMIGILLSLGANVNGADNYGYTPLYHAAVYGLVSTVRLLLEHGADINGRTHNGGIAPQFSTALRIASYYGHTDIVTLLKSWGR